MVARELERRYLPAPKVRSRTSRTNHPSSTFHFLTLTIEQFRAKGLCLGLTVK